MFKRQSYVFLWLCNHIQQQMHLCSSFQNPHQNFKTVITHTLFVGILNSLENWLLTNSVSDLYTVIKIFTFFQQIFSQIYLYCWFHGLELLNSGFKGNITIASKLFGIIGSQLQKTSNRSNCLFNATVSTMDFERTHTQLCQVLHKAQSITWIIPWKTMRRFTVSWTEINVSRRPEPQECFRQVEDSEKIPWRLERLQKRTYFKTVSSKQKCYKRKSNRCHRVSHNTENFRWVLWKYLIYFSRFSCMSYSIT